MSQLAVMLSAVELNLINGQEWRPFAVCISVILIIITLSGCDMILVGCSERRTALENGHQITHHDKDILWFDFNSGSF